MILRYQNKKFFSKKGGIAPPDFVLFGKI